MDQKDKKQRLDWWSAFIEFVTNNRDNETYTIIQLLLNVTMEIIQATDRAKIELLGLLKHELIICMNGKKWIESGVSKIGFGFGKILLHMMNLYTTNLLVI